MVVKPSKRLALLLLLFHAIVTIVVSATTIPLAARLAMLIPILLSLIYYLARDVLLLLPDSWREISFDHRTVSVLTRDGSSFSGQAANQTTVNPYFLCIGINGHRPYRTIFSDALDKDAFREFRVFLKYRP